MRIRMTILFSRAALLCLLLMATGVAISAQEQLLKINYRLAMPRPNTHLFEVTVEVDMAADAKLDTLDFQMPKWSPGRYAVFDFAKNVQEFKAFTGHCPISGGIPKCLALALPVTRIDDQTSRRHWR